MKERALWRERLGAWIESERPRDFIIVLILVNALILGLETSPTLMERIGGVLIALNTAILVVFVLEIALKLLAFGPRFFRSGWNVFDFLVVGIALVPASGPLEVLRALRILRVLRLLSQVQRLRMIVDSLIHALPGMGWAAALLLLIFYIFAVMGTMLFGETFPELWGSLGASLFTLFQVMTLESWATGVARPMFEAFPMAWLYFLPFILVSSFMVLNLFIAIIVSATNAIHEDEEAGQRRQLERTLTEVVERLERIERRIEADRRRD
ncbi:MAG: ion transporter [Wenzhouxiangellaceae bacterium]|nr:ion transporter [Wenzhouxiangellaceae bacterium]